MFLKIVKWMVAALCALIAACAVITVNVYFPEKDVKEAYKSLDEMLLKQGSNGKQPSGEAAPTGEGAAGGQPVDQPAGDGDKKEELKPQSFLPMLPELSLATSAHAADSIADELAVETSSMPDVLEAYEQMSNRLPQVNALYDSGAIGLNKQGLLSVRDKEKAAGAETLVKAENDSRKVVITGMARALQKITERKQPGITVNFNELMAKAAATFADVRREEAKPGWWIELANGRWVQK